MMAPIKAILAVFTAARDRNGNCYHAAQYRRVMAARPRRCWLSTFLTWLLFQALAIVWLMLWLEP